MRICVSAMISRRILRLSGSRLGAFNFLVAASLSVAAGNAASEDLYQNSGLTWAKVSEDMVNFATAEKNCSGVINGRSGWRLPTLKEIATERHFAAFETALLPRGVSKNDRPTIWSSTAAPSTSDMTYHATSALVYRDSGMSNYQKLIDVQATYAYCVTEDSNIKPQSETKQQSPANSTAKALKPSGTTPALVLHSVDIAAGDAVNAKAAAEEKRRLDAENKNALAAAKVLERKENARKTKTDGQIVNKQEYGDSLEEAQAKTWCDRRVPEFRKSMAASSNKLIGIGPCSCKPGGAAVALTKQYRCEFPVSYREFSTGAK